MYKIKAQHRAKQAGVDLNEVKGGLQPNRGAGAATRATDVIVRHHAAEHLDMSLQRVNLALLHCCAGTCRGCWFPYEPAAFPLHRCPKELRVCQWSRCGPA